MIVNNSFQFTDGGEFTFNTVDTFNRLVRTNYVGYYHYYNGDIYTDRFQSSNSVFLSAINNISSEYIQEKFEFDRTIEDVLSLPYDEDKLFFQPNEFINQNTINLKFKMLHENFLTLYNFAFIANNNFADGLTGWIGLTGVSNTGMVTASPLPQVGPTTDLYGMNYVTRTASDGSANTIGLSTNFGTVSSAGGEGLSGANGFEVIGMESQIKNALLKETPEDVFLTFYSPSALNIYTFMKYIIFYFHSHFVNHLPKVDFPYYL